jgi:Mg2+ and Co2+ transporter CorA
VEIKTPAFIPKSWALPEAILRRLGDTAGRQRLMNEDGHLLLILHEAPFAEDDEIRKPVLVWGLPTGEWKSHPCVGGLTALAAHLAAYEERINLLDEASEAASTPREYFEVMRHMTPLLRATRNQSIVFQEARAARPDDRQLINLRDKAGDLERAIELVGGDAKAGMEFSLAQNTEEQSEFAHIANQEARKLNRLVALFFPLATLVAVFGMNEPSQVLSMHGFWTVVAIGILSGIFIHYSAKPAKTERKAHKPLDAKATAVKKK